MKNPKKILIVKLGAIGDVVHSTIMAVAIKQKYPQCEIHYLTSTKIAPMLEENELFDKIYDWNLSKKRFGTIFSFALKFLFNRYDIIFNLTHSLKTYLVSYMAFPKKVVNKANYKESWVENYFYIAKSILPELVCPSRLYLVPSRAETEKVMEEIKDYPRPFVGFSPAGDTDKSRQGRVWNIKKWQELADKIKSEYGGTVFIFGSEDEYDLHSRLNNVVICSGKYSLKETSALLAKMDLVVSGDTGLAHMSVALDRNVIMLIGSTSPEKIKPYGEKGFYIDSPNQCKHCWNRLCNHELTDNVYTPCMEAISADLVMEKIKKERIFD